MNLGILQLSDLHFRDIGGNQLTDRAAAIAAAVRPRCAQSAALLVILNGDIAFSGKRAEFEASRKFLDATLLELRSLTGAEVLGPIMVPGNHDCDFSREGDIRPSLLSALVSEIDKLDAEGDKLRTLVLPQDEFFAFEESYSGTDREGSARVYYALQFVFERRPILVHCFNTAWVSRLQEQQGQIVFPLQIQPWKLEERPVISISVFHHPFRWFEPTNGRQFQKHVERISDLIMTGHEHDGDHFARRSSRGDELSYVEGAALDPKAPEPGFNFIDVSFADESYEVYRFAWKGRIFEPVQKTREGFIRNPRLSEEFYENTPDFERRLSQLSATFPHPTQRELKVDDIFVYPDLRVRSFLNKKGALLAGEKVLEFVATERHIILSGAPLSGKSTLAMKLYSDLHEMHGIVPLLLRGKDIKGHPAKALSKTVDKAFEEQYPVRRLEAFTQLAPKRKALIIDDWHLSQLNKSGRRVFLGEAAKQYSIVVTLGADQPWLQEMLEAAELTEISDFKYCDIRQLGHRLRGKLISKWHTFGREFEADDSEISHLVSRDEQLVNSVVGKGVFPSSPFFVLYALQVSQSSSQNALAHGAFGHVYEAYITMRLSAVSKKPTDVGLKYTYLSLIAYRMFEEQKETLTPEELSEVHGRFEEEYAIRASEEATLHQLEEAQLLRRVGENIGFLHKYCYYFFVAKHLQKLLANDPSAAGLRLRLTEMADMVHDEDLMNILIFYIYLTEDRQLIEYFIDRAKTFFDEHQPCDLSADVDFISELITPRRLRLSPGTTEANREAFRAQKDRASEQLEEKEARLVRTKYDKTLDDSLRIDFAFHALQVMGQVLRNFPGELRADLKLRLAEESYLLGLRTMKAFLSALKANVEAIRAAIEHLLLTHKALTDDSQEREASKILAYLAEGGIYAMIKRVSASVGLEDLRETYLAARKRLGESNLPVRLIDLSIKLDHFPRLPMTDVEELEHATRSLVVPFNILRMLISDYLYLFPVGYKDRQKLSALLGFDSTQALLADKKMKPTPSHH